MMERWRLALQETGPTLLHQLVSGRGVLVEAACRLKLGRGGPPLGAGHGPNAYWYAAFDSNALRDPKTSRRINAKFSFVAHRSASSGPS